MIDKELGYSVETMRDREAKELILRLTRTHCERAEQENLDANVQRAGIIASANAWDYYNKGDALRVFDTNPFNSQLTTIDQRVERAKVSLAKAKYAYEFAINTFILE